MPRRGRTIPLLMEESWHTSTASVVSEVEPGWLYSSGVERAAAQEGNMVCTQDDNTAGVSHGYCNCINVPGPEPSLCSQFCALLSNVTPFTVYRQGVLMRYYVRLVCSSWSSFGLLAPSTNLGSARADINAKKHYHTTQHSSSHDHALPIDHRRGRDSIELIVSLILRASRVDWEPRCLCCVKRGNQLLNVFTIAIVNIVLQAREMTHFKDRVGKGANTVSLYGG